MHNPPTAQLNLFSDLTIWQTAKWHYRQLLRQTSLSVSSVLLGMMMSWTIGGEAIAQTTPRPTTSTAPTTLTEVLSQIDAASSEGDVDGVMEYYGRTLRHSDGLNYNTLRNALTAFWERYPDLSYRTVLNSWQADGNAIVAETTTTITGTQANDGRPLTLNASIRSRQRLENGKIIEQTILDERTEVTTGSNPPTVDINLPDTVRPGEEFSFDAIVTEPLGDRLLLGAAIEEAVRPRGYLTPPPVELEPLSAGGLFKVGRAPARPGDRWVSAVLIRDDGISIVTERMHVTGQPVATESDTPPSGSRSN